MTRRTRRDSLKALTSSILFLGGCSSLGGETDSTTTTGESEFTSRTRDTTDVPTEDPGYTPPGESRPAMFVHLDTIGALNERIAAGDEPWATASEWFRDDVNDARDAEPESVVKAGDSHRFLTSGPGDPDSRQDYKAAIRTGDRVRDLGLAYQLLDDDTYAEKAVDLLNCWFLDEETYMAPEPSASIELFITLPKMWWGAELVRGHEAWGREDVGDESELRRWVDDFLGQLSHEIPTTYGQQNIFNWLEVTHSSGAVYLRDWDRLQTSIDRNRESGFNQLREDGLLENEIIRHASLTYSVFAIKALLTAAEISRLYAHRYDGPTLYEYSKFDDDKPALRRMCDAHVPYILDPRKWRTMGSDGDRFKLSDGFPARSMEKAGAAYEVAYSYYESDQYIDVITAGGRPVKNQPTYVDAQKRPIEKEGRPRRDERILGWTTLCHGERFRLASEQ